MKLFSYVVDHDTGYAPNPGGGVCTLCRCKYRKSPWAQKNIIELAEEGDWVIGTGGSSTRSTGRGTLIYAMRIDKKITRDEYSSRYSRKRIDALLPANDFEK